MTMALGDRNWFNQGQVGLGGFGGNTGIDLNQSPFGSLESYGFKGMSEGIGGIPNIGGDNGFLSGIFGEEGLRGLQGIGDLAGGIGDLWGGWNAMQQLGLQEEAFEYNKELTNRNALNQARLANTQMRDRQNARYQSWGGGDGSYNPHAAPEDYMAQNALSTEKIG